MSEYAHPEVLVTTEWVADHASDPKIRLVEVDVDTTQYDQGHVAGAVGWNWQTQLQDNIRRDLIEKAASRDCSASLASRTTPRHSLWRQQQLVRGVRLLAVEILRSPGRPPDERRPQEVARAKAPADHRSREGHARHLPRDRTRRVDPARIGTRFWASCRKRSPGASSTFAPLMNSQERSLRRRACPKPRNAPAIFPARRISPGRRRPTRTARSSPPTN